MTIENLKQIAIKYATTKGSRVPLAPDELCNAVVQYFNEFLKITADINTIQVAVTEEGGNIVFTITGNTLDGKAFTPIVISAAGGGGTGDVTAAGNNTFTGENTFTNEITFNTMKSEAGYIQFGNFNYETTEGYDYLYIDNTHINMQKFVGNNKYHEININADLMTYTPPDDTVYYEYRYPRKNGTFALTSDIIKNPIYFISFYANDSIEPCHLIGTMMSKNSYGTGQKTNEEFAVMLADNFYTNSNEGLAVYGKLAEKDILCIYSEDGLSISCLDEENRQVDLPVVMFFVMETEL